MLDSILNPLFSAYDAYCEYQQSQDINDLKEAIALEKAAQEALAEYVESVEFEVFKLMIDSNNAQALAIAEELESTLPEPLQTNLLVQDIHDLHHLLHQTSTLPKAVDASGLKDLRPELLCAVAGSSCLLLTVGATAAAATKGVPKDTLITQLDMLRVVAIDIAANCLTYLRKYSDSRVSGPFSRRAGGDNTIQYGYRVDRGEFETVTEIIIGGDPSEALAETRARMEYVRQKIWPSFAYSAETTEIAQKIEAVMPEQISNRRLVTSKTQPLHDVLEVPIWKEYLPLKRHSLATTHDLVLKR